MQKNIASIHRIRLKRAWYSQPAVIIYIVSLIYIEVFEPSNVLYNFSQIDGKNLIVILCHTFKTVALRLIQQLKERQCTIVRNQVNTR